MATKHSFTGLTAGSNGNKAKTLLLVILFITLMFKYVTRVNIKQNLTYHYELRVQVHPPSYTRHFLSRFLSTFLTTHAHAVHTDFLAKIILEDSSIRLVKRLYIWYINRFTNRFFFFKKNNHRIHLIIYKKCI